MPVLLETAPNPLGFIFDPAFITFSTNLIVDGEPTEPNLSLYVQLWSEDKLIVERNVPYRRHDGKVTIDLSNILDVRPEIPTDASINAYGTGIAESSVKKMIVKVEDMYGVVPEIPTGFLTIDGYSFVYGGSRYWYGFGPDYVSEGFFLLHGFVDFRGNTVVKELRKSQPEYLYMLGISGTPPSISYEIQYTDGTTSGSIPGGTVTLPAYKVSWINVGWDAVNMDAVVDPLKTVNLYSVTIGTKTVHYHLDDHDLDDDEYIIYDNGSGGCEVLRCSGRHSADVEVSKSIFKRAIAPGSNHRDGLTSSYGISATESYQYETGYYSKEYINHLRQLIAASNVWYIDRIREKFYKINVTTTRVNLYNLADDLYSLSLKWEYDERPTLSNFNL